MGKTKKETIRTFWQAIIDADCYEHYPCFLWNTGWKVSMRKFWFIKWLVFTRERILFN